MTGDDRRRLCAQCNKHVHNLSALTPRLLRRFVERHDGTECIGYVVRENGDIVTAPRWPWLGRLLSPFRHFGRGCASLLAILVPSLFAGCFPFPEKRTLGAPQPPAGSNPPKTKTVRGTCNGQIIMGEIAPPPAKPAPTKPAQNPNPSAQ
jgi:hypothetical protein